MYLYDAFKLDQEKVLVAPRVLSKPLLMAVYYVSLQLSVIDRFQVRTYLREEMYRHTPVIPRGESWE